MRFKSHSCQTNKCVHVNCCPQAHVYKLNFFGLFILTKLGMLLFSDSMSKNAFLLRRVFSGEGTFFWEGRLCDGPKGRPSQNRTPASFWDTFALSQKDAPECFGNLLLIFPFVGPNLYIVYIFVCFTV